MQVEEEYRWTKAIVQVLELSTQHSPQEDGVHQTKSDPCIYVSEGEDTFYIGVYNYVDDIILAGKDEVKMRKSQGGALIKVRHLGPRGNLS